MREISLHILDVAENGITAGADCIHIIVDEARLNNLLTITIKDNGKGVPADRATTLTNPFVTSRTTRRVGLGLSLLEAAARRCEGSLTINSQPGKGTQITTTFRYDHIDRAPMGDMASTLITLIMGNTDVDFVYNHRINGKSFELDTRDLKAELGPSYMTEPVLMNHLKQTIQKQLEHLQTDA